MTTALRKIFKPRRIALLGGNWQLGATVLANLLDAGFQGVIYPIDPGRESVNGVPAFSGIDALPAPPDVVLICTPADQVPKDVEDCARAGVRGIVVLSEGFRECGERGKALEQRIAEIIRRFPGLRVIGPNSLGFIVPHLRLNASHAAAMPAPGRIAFISESRALCSSVIDWAAQAGVGFSCFVSVGNMLDVKFGDLIDYLGADANTRAIILYLQSVGNARRFMSAASAFARRKPIVAYKAGRFVESARVAASHTGAMVTEDAVYDAAFERAGIVRVTELNDVFDVVEVLASQRVPQGPRLAIVGNAGGPAVIATDVLLSRGGALATLRDETTDKLSQLLPSVCSRANPVDLQDHAPPERFAQVIRLLIEDRDVNGILVIFAVQADTDPEAIARAIAGAGRGAGKPVLVAWMGGSRAGAGIPILKKANLATHTGPEQAVRAFLHLVSYARNIETLYQTPRDIPIHFQLNRTRLRKRLAPLLQKASDEKLNEHQGNAFLNAYGIPVTETRVAHTREEALSFAERMGYPVVLKILSPNIVHKMDEDGVVLDLKTPRAVADAYERFQEGIRGRWRDRGVEGIIVQKMVRLEYGIEMILGAKKDPVFGPVIMVGRGGFAADVVRDRQVGLPPLNERLASRMLASLRCWPLLQGYRGRPRAAIEQLIEIMIRFSYLVSDYPEIEELDVNPLLVGSDGAVALDTAVILNARARIPEADIHDHMAIHPYPEEHVRRFTLKQGAPVTLRPVRAEDEPLWHKLIGGLSERSIRQRFRALFGAPTHEMAVEYCVIDYGREIAIVAETGRDGGREIIGAAHLFADAGLDSAEYAIIVSDDWQGQGLGGALLDHCLELAERWGIRQVVADTHLGNKAMLANFLSRGFESNTDYEDGIVYLKKPITSG
uniref:Acetyltransferase n=1 Tax=Candidatus Kentrum sp. DK TaxID=2126562 RepID=A0A450RWR6_9GAMM|nr:MAG: acetyltransferase [Candidatus Kentron sp. DK]